MSDTPSSPLPELPPAAPDSSAAIVSDNQVGQPDKPVSPAQTATPSSVTIDGMPAAPVKAAPVTSQASVAGAPFTSPYVRDQPASLPDHERESNERPWHHAWRIFSARFKAMSDRAGRRMVQRTLKIGISARIFHPEPGGKGLRSRTLQYLEESIAQWVMSRNVMVFMIPTVNTNGLVHPSNIRLRDYAKHLDGLVLQGGADVSPQSYAQTATRPEWSGDPVRDTYELELLYEFNEAGKPVLGICRGCQLINVAFGGTLYQDIASDLPSSHLHVNDEYDKLHHGLQFPDDSTLAPLFAGQSDFVVNSIHHQAVRELGRDLSVEAYSGEDKVIEAIRYRKAPFLVGLQWHPEFHRAGGGRLLDCTPILDSFLRAARETRF